MVNELELSGLAAEVAAQYKVAPAEMLKTIKAACFTNGVASDAQLLLLLSVANRYQLNPFMRECYAFVSNGRMQVGVQIDGWISVAQRDSRFAGFRFVLERDKDGKVMAVTCQVFRKDWSFPGEFRVEMAEWYDATKDTWKKRPVHQLCVKAFNNAVRFTLGITGIYDPDDIEKIADSEKSTVPSAAVIETTARPVEKSTQAQSDSPAETVDGAAATPTAESDAGNAGTTAPAAVDEAPPSTASSDAPRRGRPKAARNRLKELARELSHARVTILLTQLGITNLDDATEEQAATAVARLEKRSK